jgi:phosphoribosylformylglycinamidine synthase subunit PurQ / glutaminase
MKTAVLVFPGSNCDRDARDALERVTGQAPAMVWHRETALPHGLDLVVAPGGFSYGDYLRSGAMAARSPVMDAVRAFAAKGGLVAGICNGFQILTEAGLLPGALTRNTGLKFVCRNVTLDVVQNDSPFTKGFGKKTELTVPIAHHDGCYVADAATLDALEGEGRVAFRYRDNPNGSMRDIAGVLSENRRVLGMMPHPERACDKGLGRIDGWPVFAGLMAA